MITIIDASEFGKRQRLEIEKVIKENKPLPEILPLTINLEEKWFDGFITCKEDMPENGIFLFGSNMAKIHGAGAAAVARKMGYPNTLFFGIHKPSQCCGIPTKNENIQSMSLEEIKERVDLFLGYSQTAYGKKFLFFVSAIGTGLCNYSVNDIAPLFAKGTDYDNIILCKEFYTYLNEK